MINTTIVSPCSSFLGVSNTVVVLLTEMKLSYKTIFIVCDFQFVFKHLSRYNILTKYTRNLLTLFTFLHFYIFSRSAKAFHTAILLVSDWLFFSFEFARRANNNQAKTYRVFFLQFTYHYNFLGESNLTYISSGKELDHWKKHVSYLNYYNYNLGQNCSELLRQQFRNSKKDWVLVYILLKLYLIKKITQPPEISLSN